METLEILIGVVFLLTGSFFLQGLRRIPAKPPHKGQLTIWGKRAPSKFRNEGWSFFPLYPYWYGFVPVKVERITFTITSERTRTPDRAESKIPVLVTIRPKPELLINYIDSGEETGVKDQLNGKIQERLREWGMGFEEGPADWIELNASQLEAVSVLAKKIAGDSLTEIPNYAQDVPTWIWLRYYAQPRPTKFLKNEELWAKNGWQRVRDVLTRIERDNGIGAVKALETAVNNRREEINALRTGSGKIVLEDLGCILERLNVGDIDVLGETGKRAETQAKEEQERRAEELELRFVRQRIKELMDPPFKYTAEQALEIVQTERGKVPKTINETKWNVSPETRVMIERMGPHLVNAIFGRFNRFGRRGRSYRKENKS